MNIPVDFKRDRRTRNLPIFVEEITVTDSSFHCQNCGDRGFITAFYADHQFSAREGAPPTPPKGRALSFINGGWWIGEHQTRTCPDCKGDPRRNRKQAYVKRPELLNDLTEKLHAMQDRKHAEK